MPCSTIRFDRFECDLKSIRKVKVKSKRKKSYSTKMGKHKNSAQEAVLIAFMEKHTDLVKGFARGDRVAIDALWGDITKELNSQGPPQKDASGWKKVWIDWKCNVRNRAGNHYDTALVRKKLAHNRTESRATGGGPFNKFVISPAEDSVAKICGIYTAVEGITNTLDFGVEDVDCAIVLNDLDNANSPDDDSPGPSRSGYMTPRKRKADLPLQDNLKKFMAEQSTGIELIAKNVSDHLKVAKETEENIRNIYKSIDKLCDLISEQNNETKRHNMQVEKLLHEQNYIKQKNLEIEK